MPYSEFTLSRVAKRFGLIVTEVDLFSGIAERPSTPHLRETLTRYYAIARAIATEKAKSEFVIAPVLGEVCFLLNNRISLFSGVDLPASPDEGLNGVCDFLLARSPQQLFLTTPIVAVVEAKNDGLSNGYGQCIAEMLGARVFNEIERHPEPVLFGVVTTGAEWRFLRLIENQVVMDKEVYKIEQVAKILGILAHMLEPVATAGTNTDADAAITAKGTE